MIRPVLQLSSGELGVGYALLVAMILGGSVILDRIVMTESVYDTVGAVIITGVTTSTIVGIPAAFLFFDVSLRLTPLQYAAVLLAGILKTAPLALYFRAIRREEGTIVSPITSGSHIIVVILAFLLLGEQLSLFQYLGVGFIILGTVLLSSQQSSGRFRVNYAALLAIGATILFGFKAVSYKYALIVTDSVGTAIFFIHLIGFLVALLGLSWKSVREELWSFLQFDDGSKNVELLTQSASSITSVLRIVAYSLIPVSIAGPLTGTLPAFTFLYVIILALFGIHVEEQMTQREFIYRLLSTLFVVVGILVIVL